MDDRTKKKLESFFYFIDKFHILTILFVLVLVLFVLVRQNVLGLMLGLIFIVMVAEDVIKGLLKDGVKSEIKELLIGILIAIAVLYGISFLLNTSTPISAVVTCSMVPQLDRGDMVLIRGTDVKTYGTLYMPDVSVYDITPDARVAIGNMSMNLEGSIDIYCSKFEDPDTDPFCYEYRRNPEYITEYHGPLAFQYGICERKSRRSDETFEIPCVVSVKDVYSGQEISLYPHSKEGDIVVYQPNEGDLFSNVGDIVHRAVVTVKTKEGTYYLTKGDNNHITDLQIYMPGYGGNHLIPEKNVKGNVIFGVPIVGYIKLFMSAQFHMPEQCDYIFNE
ncbi:hypothetical protein KO465_03785 [Candidatus Micrarchaeota archaeon]|nr:hypothetical protein [Candidatus Micrarchaeota archaeon]